VASADIRSHVCNVIYLIRGTLAWDEYWLPIRTIDGTIAIASAVWIDSRLPPKWWGQSGNLLIGGRYGTVG